MTARNGLMKPNTKIFLGTGLLVIAMIYIGDRLLNGLDIRMQTSKRVLVQ